MSAYDIEMDVRKALVEEGLRDGPASRKGHEKLKVAGPEAVREVRAGLQAKIDFLDQYAEDPDADAPHAV
jgi:ethanolamine utilization microcompartment shell protein EutL